MATNPRKYNIYFGIDKTSKKKSFKELIDKKNFELKENFTFYSYDPKQNILNLLEYFISNFWFKYPYCLCELFLFKLESGKYIIINNKKLKLIDLRLDNLYIIRRDSECICEKKYMLTKTELLSEIKQIKYQYEQVKKELDRIKKVDELLLENEKREEFYDVIINIQSIVGLKKGWEIKMNEDGIKKYNTYKDKELMSIGVIGNRNQGKSFLLSKISKIPLITGANIRTEGLSIKYPDTIKFKNRNFILLDSAGFENPVLMEDFNADAKIEQKDNNQNEENFELLNNNNINENQEINNNNIIDNKEKEKEKDNEKENENEKEILDINNKENENKLKNIEKEENKEFIERTRDKIITELFLQNFIISYSDILILVVGMLTYSEQLLINKIKQEIKNNEKDRKFLIIVHNLKTFTEVGQVEEYIKNRLLKSFSLNLSKKQIINFDEEKNKDENDDLKKGLFFEILHCDNGRQIDVYHLILANEDSKAGKIYNQYTYEFIENFYNNITTIEIFDIIQKVKDKFIKICPNFITNKITEKLFDNNEDIIKNKIMKLNLEKDEKLNIKKCYKDELGITFFISEDFTPKYNYFLADENTLELRLEVPGNIICNTTWSIEKENTIIKITGEKEKDVKPEKFEDNIVCSREFGEFELKIPIRTEHFQISSKEPKEGYPILENGVFIIQYEIGIHGKKVSTKVQKKI